MTHDEACPACGRKVAEGAPHYPRGDECAAPVKAGELEAQLEEAGGEPPAPHDCMENARPYYSNGALGHGWECGICGAFLQAG